MLTVVADTGPLNYLVLIEQCALLPALFGTVLVPDSVRFELGHPASPERVRNWIEFPPDWLSNKPDAVSFDADLNALDKGEQAVVALALDLRARLILMDDRAGVAVARRKGIPSVGTLGILERGARRGLIDLEVSLARLRATSFRCRPELFDTVLERHRARRPEN